MNGNGSLEEGHFSSGATLILPIYLLTDQRFVVVTILERINDLANREGNLKREVNNERYIESQKTRRPRHVFLLDGARGAGKTSTLLTLSAYIQKLQGDFKAEPGVTGRVSVELEGITRDDVVAFKPGKSFPEHDNTPKRALVLPVLNTSDLEPGQPSMEALIAILDRLLAEHRSQAKDRRDERLETRITAVQNELQQKVAAGWLLSRQKGDNAILRDSVNYEEYLATTMKTSVDGYDRVQTWRGFINNLLDTLEYTLLIVAFDDADVAPQITDDMLRTIRVFLDHPRIVTLFAADLRSVRKALTANSLDALAQPIQSLSSSNSPTARDWRAAERQEIEEYLEKVLPRQDRFYVDFHNDPLEARRDGTEAEPRDDFKRLFMMPFDEFCLCMSNRYRDRFFQAKLEVQQRVDNNLLEIGSIREQRDLEYFLSWWLYRHWYGPMLRPRTIRHMRVLHDYYLRQAQQAKSGFHASGRHDDKRLTVVLFENPLNTILVARMRDHDRTIFEWLSRQRLSSKWIGERQFLIENWEVPEGGYSYCYLFFRMDLAIAVPIQLSSSLVIPKGLLPIPGEPNLLSWGSFWPGSEYQPYFGVGHSIAHSSIPTNCIYFYDVASLPDVAFQDPDDEYADDAWTFELSRRWPEFFYRRWASRPPALAAELSGIDYDNSAEAGPFDKGPFHLLKGNLDIYNSIRRENRKHCLSEAYLRDCYLIEVVFPLASVAASELLPKRRLYQSASNLLLAREQSTNFHKKLRSDVLGQHFNAIRNSFGRTQHDGPAHTCHKPFSRVITVVPKVRAPQASGETTNSCGMNCWSMICEPHGAPDGFS